MAGTLETRVHALLDGATIELSGDVDAGAREKLDRAFADAVALGAGSLLLNFDEVAYINSTGIALIVGLLGRARAERIAVAACGLSEHYRNIFEITRLSDFMSIYADESTAVTAMGGGER